MRDEEFVDEVGVVLGDALFADGRGRDGFGVVTGDAAHHVRVGRGEDRGRGDVARANCTGRTLVVAGEVLLAGKRLGRLRLLAVAAAALELGVVASLVVVVAETALLVVRHLGAKRMRPVDKARVVEITVRCPGAVQHRARRFAGEKRKVFPVAEGEARSHEPGVGLAVLRQLEGFARDRAETVGVAGRLRAGTFPFGRRFVAAVADVAEVRLHVDRRAAAREEALGDAPVRVEDEISQPLGFGGIPLHEECLAVLPGHAEGDLRVGRALFVAHDASVRDFDANEIAPVLGLNALLFADVGDFDALRSVAALAVGVGVLVVVENRLHVVAAAAGDDFDVRLPVGFRTVAVAVRAVGEVLAHAAVIRVNERRERMVLRLELAVLLEPVLHVLAGVVAPEAVPVTVDPVVKILEDAGGLRLRGGEKSRREKRRPSGACHDDPCCVRSIRMDAPPGSCPPGRPGGPL